MKKKYKYRDSDLGIVFFYLNPFLAITLAIKIMIVIKMITMAIIIIGIIFIIIISKIINLTALIQILKRILF